MIPGTGKGLWTRTRNYYFSIMRAKIYTTFKKLCHARQAKFYKSYSISFQKRQDSAAVCQQYIPALNL